MRKKTPRIYAFFVMPAVIGYTIFWILPVFNGFFYSLTDWNGIGRSYQIIGIDNYIRLFSDFRLVRSLGFTIHYTLYLVLFVNIIALCIAMMLTSNIRGMKFFRALYFFPAVLSMLTVGLIFNQIFYHVIPWIGNTFHITALQNNLLADGKTAEYGILLVNIWQGIAIPIVLYIAGIQNVPIELYEVSFIEGANAFQKFKNITFPFIIPVISMNLVITLKSGLMVFDYIAALTGGGPGRATESIAYLIYSGAFKEMKFSYAVTESFVIFLLITAISLIQIKVLGKKEAHV